jgi:hypothetical protein
LRLRLKKAMMMKKMEELRKWKLNKEKVTNFINVNINKESEFYTEEMLRPRTQRFNDKYFDAL